VNGRTGRLLWPALGLLAVTALFTVGGELAPRHVDRCADSELLLDPLAIDPASVPAKETEWRPLEAGRGIRKGTIPASHRDEPELGFLLFRSWGLPVTMQNPAKSIPGRLEADRMQLRWIDVDGQRVPVRFEDQTARNMVHFAMYTFAYDGRPVASAFSTRMRSIFDELLHGSRPITLMAVSARTSRFRQEDVEARAEAWLRAAWSHYRDACGLGPVGDARIAGSLDGD
jgi:hypothetical protein